MYLTVFLKKADTFCLCIAGIVTIFLTFLTVTDVMLRYVFFSPIPGASESTELMLPWIVFLPMSYTLSVGGHVRVSLLVERFSLTFKRYAEILDCVIGIFFFGMLTYYGYLLFLESFLMNEFMMATVKLPWWLGKMALPVGLGVFFIRYCLRLCILISGRMITEPKRLSE